MKQRIPKFSENELIASICKDSFYEFLLEFWDVVISEPPIWNWHIRYLCDELQKVAERVFLSLPKLYDLIINISPGSTKSTICSIMFPAWCWTRKPSIRTIGASYAYSLAMDLSRKSRDVVKSDKFRACFPEVNIREDQDSKGYFVNTKNGDRFSVGVNGSVTGMHGHLIIVDDPLDPNQAASSADLKAANNWMAETLPSRKVNKAVAPMILIMQRLHQNDPTAAKLEKREFSPVKHICIPAELTDNVNPPELREHYIDGLMDPVRLSHQVLRECLADVGDYGYAGQYLQDPVPRGGAMFMVDQLKYDVPPTRFQRVVRYWDKAGTSGGGAFSVGVKMAQDYENRFWVLDVVRGQWDSNRREKEILKTAEKDSKKVTIGVEQEPGSGGKESAESTVRMLRGYIVRVNKVGASDGDKEKRADPFSVQVNGGNVYLVKAKWNAAYIEELRYFPRSKYKDQVDSSSGAFNLVYKPAIVVGGLRSREVYQRMANK